MTHRRIKESELQAVRAALISKQGGQCAICDILLDREGDACVDHSHSQGFIRGVLCRNCNQLEGRVFNCAKRGKRNKSPIEWLLRLLEYLKLHQECQTGLIHHTHRTADEKRLRQNKRERLKRKRAKKAKLELEKSK